MRATPFVLMFWLVLCGCGSQSTSTMTSSPAAVQHGKIIVGGYARTYRLFRPPSLEPKHAAPLVILLHACGGTGDQFAAMTKFDEEASSGGFVAAYPDGPSGSCWNEFLDPTLPDDFSFLGQLLNRLATELPIDKNRIFVTGLQSGGHMAYTLACAMPDRIAGIASVSGGMPLDSRKASMRCPDVSQSKPVSVMEMHGTADDFLPYEGGGPLQAPTTITLLNYWATIDGCSGDPVETHNGITTTSLWRQCKGATVVRLDTVSGGHNTWFGSGANAVAGEPNATAVVWDFFKALSPTA